MTRTLTQALSDAELLTQARSGDSDSYFALWSRHRDFVCSLAHRLTRNEYDRDDLVSSVRDRIWAAIRNGNGPTLSFRAYAATAVRNTFANGGREPSMVDIEDLGELPDGAAGFEQVEEASVLKEALSSLPERTQEVVFLAELCQASTAEIAEHFGTSRNNASQMVRRASSSLRYAFIDAHMGSAKSAGPKCVRCRTLIRRLVAGDASPEEEKKVDSHIEDDECEGCRAAYLAAMDSGHFRAILAPVLLGAGATADWFKVDPSIAGASTTTSGATLAASTSTVSVGALASVTAVAAAAVIGVVSFPFGSSSQVFENAARPEPVEATEAVGPPMSADGGVFDLDLSHTQTPVDPSLGGDTDSTSIGEAVGESQTNPPPNVEPVPAPPTPPEPSVPPPTTAVPAPTDPDAGEEPPPEEEPEPEPSVPPPTTAVPAPTDPDAGEEPPPEEEPEPEPFVAEPGDPGSLARSETFTGRWALAVASRQYATSDPATCGADTPTSTSINVTYPVEPSATRNILTWNGSGTPNENIVVNGVPVSAQVVDDTGTYTINTIDVQYWQATAEVPRSPDDTYLIEGLSTETPPGMCAIEAVVGSVNLISLYEHDTNPERIFTLATGLASLHSDYATEAHTVPSATGIAAEAFALTLEGDAFGAGESAWLGDQRLDDGSGIWEEPSHLAHWTLPEGSQPAPFRVTSGDDHVLASMMLVVSDLPEPDA